MRTISTMPLRFGASSAAAGQLAAATFLLALPCVLGCAGGASGRGVMAERFARAKASGARALAPRLFARASRARDEAARARARGEQTAASDYEMSAGLFLDAALAEAEQTRLERRRAAAERRAAKALERQAEHQRVRLSVEAEIARLEAARVARQEARRVFQQDGRHTGQTNGRKDRQQLAEDRKRAADFLLKRARLMLAAAVAMGARSQDIQGAERAIEQAEAEAAGTSARGISASVSRAERALAAAEQTLGAARAQYPGPNHDEIAALVSAAEERGLACERLDRGVVVTLADVFAAGTSRLSSQGKRKLQQLAALVRAHPHGPVRIRLGSAAGAHGSSQARVGALRNARGRRVVAALSSGPRDANRFRFEDEAPAAGGEGSLDVAFVAYGPAEVPSKPSKASNGSQHE